MKRVLILGGTGDAIKIAVKTSALIDFETIYSLAGRTNRPNIPPCEIRTGGFGGVNGLINYLQKAKIDIVIDATHPFADKIAANAAESCDRIGIPRIKFCRPAWKKNGISWISSSDYVDTVKKLKSMGERIFLSIGTNKLETFSILSNKWFLVRTIDKPILPIPLRNYRILIDRGPFKEIQEHALLTKFSIDVLVSKNSGGVPAAKLHAAYKLGIPIIMIEEPSPPAGKVANTIDKTLEWLIQQN